MSQIITLVIGAASVYFFYANNFIVALILFTWFLSRLFGYNLKRIFEGVGHSEVEQRSNVVIELKVNIASILSHEAISSLYEKLKKHEKFASRFKTQSEWVKAMIDNYKKKYKNEDDFTHEKTGVRYLWDSVKYNIKNNTLWENGQVEFSDTIQHEVFIPYEYKGEKEEEERFWHDIGSGLRIRVLVVNGLIKVQIGNFDKDTSSEIYRDSGLAAYKTWETITTFPLMYVSQSIPTHYLNLSMYATDSYKGLLKREPSKEWTKDWKELNAEIADYNYLQIAFAGDAPADNKFNKTYKKFYTKSLEMLATDNFSDPYKRKEDDWPVPGWMEDNNITYLNDFLHVFIADYKDMREKNEKYYLTDYHEEHP
ncbi:MAG: hypothetical protein AAB947_01425 [Patescibacteria group bacterium]